MTNGLALQEVRQTYQRFINAMLLPAATYRETSALLSAPVQVNRKDVLVCFLRIHPELVTYREELVKMYPGAPVFPFARAEWERISG